MTRLRWKIATLSALFKYKSSSRNMFFAPPPPPSSPHMHHLFSWAPPVGYYTRRARQRYPCNNKNNNNIMHHISANINWGGGWCYGIVFGYVLVLFFIFLNDTRRTKWSAKSSRRQATISLAERWGWWWYKYVFTNWIIHHRRLCLSDKSDTQEFPTKTDLNYIGTPSGLTLWMSAIWRDLHPSTRPHLKNFAKQQYTLSETWKTKRRITINGILFSNLPVSGGISNCESSSVCIWRTLQTRQQ